MSPLAAVSGKDEEAVQELLGTTLTRMGGGRFRCDLETQVAAHRRSDITVTATQAPVQLSIEIKHDRKVGRFRTSGSRSRPSWRSDIVFGQPAAWGAGHYQPPRRQVLAGAPLRRADPVR